MTYLDYFKKEKHMDNSVFELLDELFGDVDAYTADRQLLTQSPEVYVDEAKLREKVSNTLHRLGKLE